MILDRGNIMSDGQAVTVTAPSTDVIGLGPVGGNDVRDIGVGEPMYLVIQVAETVLADGNATVAFELQTSPVEAFNSGVETLWSRAATGKATLVAGYRVAALAVPHGVKQFLRINYTVATGPLTAGKFDAFLVKDVQAWRAYETGTPPNLAPVETGA